MFPLTLYAICMAGPGLGVDVFFERPSQTAGDNHSAECNFELRQSNARAHRRGTRVQTERGQGSIRVVTISAIQDLLLLLRPSSAILTSNHTYCTDTTNSSVCFECYLFRASLQAINLFVMDRKTLHGPPTLHDNGMRRRRRNKN